jgi:DNA-binding transcriptional LysR family regulator
MIGTDCSLQVNDPMDRLAAMTAFRRVIDLGSFRAAARDLGRSNASISKQVSDLEAELGATLIARTTRRLAPTEVGRAYYERCARILDELAEAEAAVASLEAAPRGILRVNAPMSFGLLHLARALPAYMEACPNVRVDLVMNDRAVDLLEEGFDVALRVRTSLPDSSLIARRLAPIRRVLCTAPEYLERYGEPERPEELVRHRCLIYSLSTSPTEWTFTPRGEREPLTVRVQPYFTANSSMAVREALLAGIGIALVPTFVVGPDIAEARLRTVLPDFEVPPHTMYTIYPASRHLSPKVRSFVDFLVERYGEEPYWESYAAPR